LKATTLVLQVLAGTTAKLNNLQGSQKTESAFEARYRLLAYWTLSRVQPSRFPRLAEAVLLTGWAHYLHVLIGTGIGNGQN
jgi:hypothetical protein